MADIATPVPQIYRPAFFDGQRLSADDLSAVNAFHRELRWLHSRSLHTWGIAVGFMVTGARGDRTVTVAPGYALDCVGRDLLLAEPVTLPVPPLAGSGDDPDLRYLTVSYLEDDDLAASDARAGVCDGYGAVRRREAPRIRWQAVGDNEEESILRLGLDVILATASIKNCKLAQDVSLAERREARPSDQPYIAAGQSVAGETAWNVWSDGQQTLGVETIVDTSGGKFSSTPRYQANVVGNRVLQEPNANGVGGQFLEGFITIADPTPVSFRLRMTMPLDVTAAAWTMNPKSQIVVATMDELESTLNWHVVWMGVEG